VIVSPKELWIGRFGYSWDEAIPMRNLLFKARLIAFILAMIANQWAAGSCDYGEER